MQGSAPRPPFPAVRLGLGRPPSHACFTGQQRHLGLLVGHASDEEHQVPRPQELGKSEPPPPRPAPGPSLLLLEGPEQTICCTVGPPQLSRQSLFPGGTPAPRLPPENPTAAPGLQTNPLNLFDHTRDVWSWPLEVIKRFPRVSRCCHCCLCDCHTRQRDIALRFPSPSEAQNLTPSACGRNPVCMSRERGASPLAPGLTLQPTLPREQTDVGMCQLSAVTVTLSKSLTPPPPSPLLPVWVALGTPSTQSSGGEETGRPESSSRCATRRSGTSLGC